MATFKIQLDPSGKKMVLAASPDWVVGVIKNYSFSGSIATQGILEDRYYDEYAIKDLIEYLCKKIIHNYESNFFKDILFKIYNAISGSFDLEGLFLIGIRDFSYHIDTFRTENILSRKMNLYLPLTERNKQKYSLLYMLISLQHVICTRSNSFDMRIPTVTKM